MLKAGRLRHRVDIEAPVNTQDATTGEITVTWTAVHTNVPAAIEPVSVREAIAASQLQSEISVKIVIRYIPGLQPNMRIRHGATLYNPTGFLADLDSNVEYITIPCGAGINEG